MERAWHRAHWPGSARGRPPPTPAPTPPPLPRRATPRRPSGPAAKILAALDRLEAELGDGEYLVGDRFSVADLTAASLFYPLVLPDEGPMPADRTSAAGFERFREPLDERPGYKWVEEMFRRHRKPAKISAATASAA